MSVGTKHDHHKVRMDLLPPDVEWLIAECLTGGAAEYGDRNWESGMAWSRLYGALRRHLAAFWGGEDRDTETDLPHLIHACCCAMFLSAYYLRNIGDDDRPTGVCVPRGFHDRRIADGQR